MPLSTTELAAQWAESVDERDACRAALDAAQKRVDDLAAQMQERNTGRAVKRRGKPRQKPSETKPPFAEVEPIG